MRRKPKASSQLGCLLDAAGVRFSGFLIACLALTPNRVIQAYLGHVGKHVMDLILRMARKAVTQAVAATDTERAESDSDTA